ncbi:hypothetical protein EVAR_21662_1 [Eumeta japonica]|uniref:Uncharacterized protein n=1 Tax=Eumeta variegata TaxID=151549 RepID=A0A4C1VGX8_EUMVA|nr:hypothetical protein EVAR_21662_1 [Eumeta japonica]
MLPLFTCIIVRWKRAYAHHSPSNAGCIDAANWYNCCVVCLPIKPNEDRDCNLERDRDRNQDRYPNQSWEQDDYSKQKMEEHIPYPRRRGRERKASILYIQFPLPSNSHARLSYTA